MPHYVQWQPAGHQTLPPLRLASGLEVFPLDSKNWKEVLGFGAEDLRSGVRKKLKTRQWTDVSIFWDCNRVTQEVSWKVFVKCVARIEFPVSISHRIYFLDAFEGFWIKKRGVWFTEVLIPQSHSEAKDLPPGPGCLQLACWCQMVWLIGTHCNLSVPPTIHRSLIYVGRPNNYVLIINWKGNVYIGNYEVRKVHSFSLTQKA